MRWIAAAASILFAASVNAADCPTPPTKPTQGVACTDPDTGYTLTRLTNWSSDGMAYLVRNDYSRRDPFNITKTRALVYRLDGWWQLYNVTTSAWIKQLSSVAGDAEPVWSATDATQFYFIDNGGGLRIRRYDIDDDSVVTVANFTGRLPWPTATYCSSGSEGSPSKDQRYWAFVCANASYATLGFFVYDMVADEIESSLNESHGMDYITMSPTGTYVVVGSLADMDDGLSTRTRMFLRDFSDWGYVHCVDQHSDIALGLDGDDYYMSVDHSNGGAAACSPADGNVFTRSMPDSYVSHDFASGRIDQFNTYNPGTIAGGVHLSGKALDFPGRFIWSSYACSGPGCGSDYADSIMMGDVANASAHIKVASINTVWASYNTEPHAAISRDGTLVAFNSTWGNSGDDALDVYVLQLPTTFTITTTTMANGTNGQAYQADVQTSGGTQPPTACITSAGAVPSGATWSVVGNACRLSDASAETGTYNFTLQATDSNSNTDTQAFTLTIVAALQIDTTSPMPDGTLSSGYSEQLVCSGGTPPRTFSCCQLGSLPTGLTLESDGTFSGTFQQAGVFTFTARCTDNVPANADKELQITVTSGATLSMRQPIIYAGDTYATFRLGATGLDFASDCTAIVKDSGGATVDTVTSTSGPAIRTLVTSALTASSTYSATFTCDGAQPDVTPYPFVTQATPAVGDRTVPIQFGTPPAILVGAARVTVEYDDNAALSTPATVQNTSCGSGCTVSLTIPAGLYYYRWKWQTAADAVLATSTIQTLAIP